MNKYLLTFFVVAFSLSLSAQTQSWQWVKAGGSSSDNTGVQAAQCRIAGCDAKGNVYGVGDVNGPNMRFDTFSSAGSYSVTGDYMSYLLFSYDCGGNMRWAKQIGDEGGDLVNFGVATDPEGNTYLACQLQYGQIGGLVRLYIGDSIIDPSQVRIQPYLCMMKFDSLGRLVWFKNFQEDTALAPHVGSFQTVPLGLRIGSSGNIWMNCNLDSNYAISPNLHTTLYGKYNVEINPTTGDIMTGYYTSNRPFGDAYSIDTYWDMDENENYYETGTLNGDFGAGGDTLILANQTIAPDTSRTAILGYIYSLDKHGNFRFIKTNTNYCNYNSFNGCKFDYKSNMLVANWQLDTLVVFGGDTFRFNPSRFAWIDNESDGLLAIDTNGNVLWGKYITYSTQALYFIFVTLPQSSYPGSIQNNGLIICNNSDTLFNRSTSTSIYDYTTIISQINQNGSLATTHTAHLGNTGNMTGDNKARYGATDWRGNVYLGGTVTNFFATPADSVVNTDATSGNFFIAKLGISDCSCPTPGVQFTQTAHGDTVDFYGSSLNHCDSIHWRLGDGSVSSSDTFTHIYSNHDSTYTVTAIAYSGCGIDSITKQIAVTSVGIKTIEPDKTNLYPNPVTNTVYLNVSGPATVGLVLANGSSVWQGPVQLSQQGTYVFDMSKYASALYYFIVQYTNGKTDVMQVVKK